MENPHTRTKPKADRTLQRKTRQLIVCVQCHSVALGDGRSTTMTSNKLAQGGHEPAVPGLLPKSLDELISPFRTKGTLCNNSASIHRSCGAPNRSCCPPLSYTARALLGTPGGLEGNGGGVMRDGERTFMVLINMFFENLGQHFCLLLQFHCPLLLLGLLCPLLIRRIMFLQQFLRFLDLLLFPPTFPPRRAGGRRRTALPHGASTTIELPRISAATRPRPTSTAAPISRFLPLILLVIHHSILAK